MRDKKLQVFVSSTFTDLIEERQAAVEAILSSGHIPAGMELFSAGDESQMTVIERWIDESDVYLLILGGRYGSLEKRSGKSYTHLEYDYALKMGKPLFAVVISENALERKIKEYGRPVMEQDSVKELKEFKSLVLSHLVKFWEDKKDIKIAIHETLSDFSFRKGLTGWVRGDNAFNAGVLAEEIARLTKENSELRAKVDAGLVANVTRYSGITFEELRKLLTRRKVEVNGAEITLFDFFIRYASRLLKGFPSSGDSLEQFRMLQMFKLVEFNSRSIGAVHVYLSEDGHNFYLNLLAKNES